MPRHAEHELLSARVGGMLQLGYNTGCYVNGNQDDAVKASGTLTSTGTAPSNNDTVTIDSQTYTFKTSLTASTTANEVLIGANAAASLTNLKAAINGAAGGGTQYGSLTTAHATVDAGTLTATTLALTAKLAGTAGNSIATTEASSQLSFGEATLSGGTAQTVANVQADIRANTPYPVYETLQERTARALDVAKAIGDITTVTMSNDDTVAEVIARTAGVAGKTATL